MSCPDHLKKLVSLTFPSSPPTVTFTLTLKHEPAVTSTYVSHILTFLSCPFLGSISFSIPPWSLPWLPYLKCQKFSFPTPLFHYSLPSSFPSKQLSLSKITLLSYGLVCTCTIRLSAPTCQLLKNRGLYARLPRYPISLGYRHCSIVSCKN
jgi:hypothetical protein